MMLQEQEHNGILTTFPASILVELVEFVDRKVLSFNLKFSFYHSNRKITQALTPNKESSY